MTESEARKYLQPDDEDSEYSISDQMVEEFFRSDAWELYKLAYEIHEVMTSTLDSIWRRYCKADKEWQDSHFNGLTFGRPEGVHRTMAHRLPDLDDNYCHGNMRI